MKKIFFGICISLGLISISLGNVEDGLVAYYPFNENANDESGNGNNGTIYGATFTTDRFGNENSALDFNGVDHRVDCGNGPGIDLTHALSMAAWVKVRSTDNRQPRVISKGIDRYVIIFQQKTSMPVVYYRGVYNHTSGVSSRFEFNSNIDVGDEAGWYFLVTTFDADAESQHVNTYINGELTASFNAGDTIRPAYSNKPLIIGNYWYPEYYQLDGAIDDVRIYNRALSAEEVEALFNETSTPSLSCSGFLPPMANGPVTVKKNRVLPIKTQLFDSDGIEITDQDIVAMPVLQILYTSVIGGEPIDVSDEALSAGNAYDGNQFLYNADGIWQYNLKVKNYTSPGTYSIHILSGNNSEYVIDDSYTAAQFIVK